MSAIKISWLFLFCSLCSVLSTHSSSVRANERANEKGDNASLAAPTAAATPLVDSAALSGLSANEYGSLYLLEQKNREILPWKISAGDSFESGNPYVQVHGFSIIPERAIGRFHWIGLQATTFITAHTHLTRVLNSELGVQGWGQTVKTPRTSLYGIWTLIPLSGHLNFFNAHVMEAELGFRLGLGRIAYDEDLTKFGILWSIRPIVHVTEHINIQFGIGQEIESPFNSQDSLARLKGEFNVGYQF